MGFDGNDETKKKKKDETCKRLAIPHQRPNNWFPIFALNVKRQPQQPLLTSVTICSAVCVHSHLKLLFTVMAAKKKKKKMLSLIPEVVSQVLEKKYVTSHNLDPSFVAVFI